MFWLRMKKEKSKEEINREMILKNAKEQIKKLNHFGLSIPVIIWRV